MMPEPVVLTPIGTVRSPVTGGRDEDWEQVEADIVLREGLVEGLRGLDEFSHIQVVFLAHDADPAQCARLTRHPKDREDLPEVGVFATRSQYRPNPVLVSIVQLLAVDGNVLHARGLDAFDGAPVLDVKPWVGAPGETRAPGWVSRLDGNG